MKRLQETSLYCKERPAPFVLNNLYSLILIALMLGFSERLFCYNANTNSKVLNYCIVEPITSNRILPNTKWNNLICKTNININSALDEYEPFSFIIRSDRYINDIEILSNDLKGKKGGIINNNNVDIKIVKVWYQADGAWKSHRKLSNNSILVPELLLNDDKLIFVDNKEKTNYVKLSFDGKEVLKNVNDFRGIRRVPNKYFPVNDKLQLQPFDLEKNKNKQIWVTIKIPKFAIPDSYYSKLKLVHNGIVLKEIKYSVKVLPFYLDDPCLNYTLFYRGTLNLDDKGFIFSDEKNKRQLLEELLNMKNHGISNATIYQKLKLKNKNYSKESIIDKIEEYFSLRKIAGYEEKELYYLGRLIGLPNTKTKLNELIKDIKIIRKKANQYGYSELYLYGIDEAKGSKLNKQIKYFKRLKKEGIKIMASGYNGHSEITKGLTNLLLYNGKSPEEEIKEAHKYGGLIYSYANPQVGIENPLIYRVNYGFELWRKGFDGSMDYAYQHSMGFSWYDFDHKYYRDHNFTYPTINGVIDTIAWEGYREAIDDIKYLTTLINIINKRRSSKKTIQVKKYINELKNKNKIESPDKIRKRIIDYILNLR